MDLAKEIIYFLMADVNLFDNSLNELFLWCHNMEKETFDWLKVFDEGTFNIKALNTKSIADIKAMRDLFKENYEHIQSLSNFERAHLQNWGKTILEIKKQIDLIEKYQVKGIKKKLTLIEGFNDYEPSQLLGKLFTIKTLKDKKEYLQQQKNILDLAMNKVKELEVNHSQSSESLRKQHKQILYLETYLRARFFSKTNDESEIIDYQLEESANSLNYKFSTIINQKSVKKTLANELYKTFKEIYRPYDDNLSMFLTRFLHKLNFLQKIFTNDKDEKLHKKILNYIQQIK